jgi:hypothetical protein
MYHTMSLNSDHCTAAQIIIGTTITSSTYSTITSATRIKIGTTWLDAIGTSVASSWLDTIANRTRIGTSTCINGRNKINKVYKKQKLQQKIIK